MNDECVRCHRTMHTDDGCDPTDLCHNCAHERVDELAEQVRQLREALDMMLSSAHPNERDHPAMFCAWKEARTALAAAEEK